MKRKGFEIVALVIVLIPQVAHTVYLFKANSQYDNPWFAWCYAIGVDMAILIFTLRGWIWTTLAYLAATLAHNMAYQFLPQSDFSAILIGISLSGTIFSFSHVFYTRKKKDTESATESKEMQFAKRMYCAMTSGVYFEAQPYRCPSCGLTFPSAKKLNGHISAHKVKNEWNESAYGDWKKENEQRNQIMENLTMELE